MKRLLICSLILNFAFIAFVLLLVFKRDSIMQIFPYSTSMAVHPKYIETNLYLRRKDIYENLPEKELALVFAGDSVIDFVNGTNCLNNPQSIAVSTVILSKACNFASTKYYDTNRKNFLSP